MEFLSYSSSVLIRPLQSNVGVQQKSVVSDGTTLAAMNLRSAPAPESGLDDAAKLFSGEPDSASERELDESAVCV
jgi:hypothetical protein